MRARCRRPSLPRVARPHLGEGSIHLPLSVLCLHRRAEKLCFSDESTKTPRRLSRQSHFILATAKPRFAARRDSKIQIQSSPFAYSAGFASRPLRFLLIRPALSLSYILRIGFNAKNAKVFAKFPKTLPRDSTLCELCDLSFATLAFSAKPSYIVSR